jgi:hypothetical protein
MTRKNKNAKTPITWYGGRFPCIPARGTIIESHLFLWGTLTKEIASKILPAEAPDSALLDLYHEASASQAPHIVHLIDERLLPLGKSLAGVTLKAGKREAFSSLVSEILHRCFMEQLQATTPSVSYLSDGVSSEEVAAFFSSAAALYRVSPWEIFTCSGFLFCLHAPSLGLSNSLVQLEAFTSSRGAPVLVVKLDINEELDVELEFLSREDAPESLVKELDANQWELAAPEALPLLYVYRDGVSTSLSLPALQALRATLEAVSYFITRHRHLSLLPEVTDVTESLTLAWLSEAEVQITGPHPDFDFTPYEPSENDFNEREEPLDDDLDEDNFD